MRYSKNWKNWIAVLDLKTCKICRRNHGKIYQINENVKPSPPIHLHCRCEIERLRAIFIGDATNNGSSGADWYLKYFNRLPDYYISRKEAADLGWRSYKGNLNRVAPNKMMFAGIFSNKEGKLPSATGRIWYEADINYTNGYRNSDRILFSNDGLMFVTYDHYETFCEIEVD